MAERKTTTEAELREWLAAGEHVEDIAERLNVHASSVYGAMLVLGLRTQYDKRRVERDAQPYIDAMRRGQTLAQIAAAHDMPYITLYKWLARNGQPTSRRAALRQEPAQTA